MQWLKAGIDVLRHYIQKNGIWESDISEEYPQTTKCTKLYWLNTNFYS